MAEQQDNLASSARDLGSAYDSASARVGKASREICAATDKVKQAQQRASQTSRAFGRALSSSFEDAVFKGQSLSQTLRGLVQDLSRIALRQALSPIASEGGTFLSSLFGAGGGAKLFARGGIINRPTLTPLGQGAALIGEAGPEAVLPLKRGADGRLGVSAQNARRPLQVHVSITTPDAESFRRSETQTASLIRRAVMRGARNL